MILPAEMTGDLLWKALTDWWAYSGVRQPPAPKTAAPQTYDQLAKPGAWTPDDVLAKSYELNKQLYLDFFAEQDKLNREQSAWQTKIIVGAAIAVLVILFILSRRIP